jgi:hypothetical protein
VGREGVAGRKQGQNAALACPNMCGGNLELSLSVKILSKMLLMAKNDVKT